MVGPLTMMVKPGMYPFYAVDGDWQRTLPPSGNRDGDAVVLSLKSNGEIDVKGPRISFKRLLAPTQTKLLAACSQKNAYLNDACAPAKPIPPSTLSFKNPYADPVVTFPAICDDRWEIVTDPVSKQAYAVATCTIPKSGSAKYGNNSSFFYR